MNPKRLLTSLALGLALVLSLLWLLEGAGLPVARAVTLTVSNTNDSGAGSLRQAIADAVDGDTILFSLTYPATITLTGGQLSVSKTITIAGPGADNLFISGNGTARVFSISGGQVALQGLTVMRGAALDGGGIRISGSSTAVTLANVTILSNAATYGGGVYVDSGSATLSGGQVVFNTADSNGGGVYVDESSAVFTQTAGNVGSNTADNGGGVYVSSGSLMLSGGQIVSNTADWGGGVYVSSGSTTLSGGQIASNTAGLGGGLLVLFDSAVFAQTAGTVASNTADRGGGVYAFWGSATLSGGQVASNTAADRGGGVFVYGGSAILSGGQIISNTATEGGGVYVDLGSAAFTQTVGTIGFSAADDGGGAHVSSGSATLNGGQIASNTASWPDGDVTVHMGGAAFTQTAGIVASNVATYGGGVYVYGGSATLSGGHVLSNTAASRGGGVYVYGGSATLSGGHVLSNTAPRGGGVYAFLDSAVFTQTAGSIGFNTAHDGGGVHVYEASAMMSGGQVISNTASIRGGGVFVDSGSATLSGGQIGGNAAPGGSALYLHSSGGAVTTTVALTLAGDIHQAGGTFYGSAHDLRVEGVLALQGGTFYAPATFDLSGVFSHIGGTYAQTQDVNGSADVGFPKAGGAILNANGLDLGRTEVVIQAGQACANAPAVEVAHCYAITPSIAGGRAATIAFTYHSGELSGGTCSQVNAYRGDGGSWQGPLALDEGYATGGRSCTADPHSIRVQGIDAFSSFALATAPPVYLPLVFRNWP